MSGKTNANLLAAKRNQNDEFYTQSEDIEKELENYTEHFEDKVVYCNCDTEDSNFVKYFNKNFNKLKLKHGFYSERDFRSIESINNLIKADIVVTNPPFSLFKDYMEQLRWYNKKFLIIGPKLAATNNYMRPSMASGKVWFGCNDVRKFTIPGGDTTILGNIGWYTNLKPRTIVKRHLPLRRNYIGNEWRYPKYDNYDAIEVNRVVDIPKGFQGVVGVPASYIDKHDPDQFEILDVKCNLRINGKNKFKRIMIREKAA